MLEQCQSVLESDAPRVMDGQVSKYLTIAEIEK